MNIFNARTTTVIGSESHILYCIWLHYSQHTPRNERYRSVSKHVYFAPMMPIRRIFDHTKRCRRDRVNYCLLWYHCTNLEPASEEPFSATAIGFNFDFKFIFFSFWFLIFPYFFHTFTIIQNRILLQTKVYETKIPCLDRWDTIYLECLQLVQFDLISRNSIFRPNFWLLSSPIRADTKGPSFVYLYYWTS